MKTLKRFLTVTMAALFMGAFAMTTQAQNTDGLQYFSSYGQDGLNTFEGQKVEGTQYDGFKLKWGAAFTQQWQDLIQSNDNGGLNDIGPGFNLATANLNLDAQLADGMRLHLVTYLSSRHHSEAWVKGGYLQADKLPMLHSDLVDNLMQYLRLRIGHMEVNYGDNHFRRTDNANSLRNPFVGNYLMDSFTTEVGAEAYLMNSGVIAMLGVTGGQLHPDVTNPDGRTPSVYGKLGYDNYAKDGLRFRLTGSFYHNNNPTQLYHGDRSGARYYEVMAPGDAWSGRVQPAFSTGFTSYMINPFVKYEGFEFYGVFETTTERKSNGGNGNNAKQYSVEGIYRFGNADQLFIGARYNTVNGDLAGAVAPTTEQSVDRTQISAGWFMTKNVLMKGEYVIQNYNDFGTNSLYNGAQFKGLMVEAAIAF